MSAIPPFRFGKIVSGEYFADRDAEAHALAADIRNGTNVVLISPRRFGKTSLMLRVIDDVRRAGVLVAYVDVLRTPSKRRLADALATALYEGLLSGIDRAREKATSFFSHLALSPRVTLKPDGSVAFEFGPSIGPGDRDIDATLEGLLRVPAEVASERKRGVALVLDEFQEVVDLDPHLPATMRSVFQTQSEVAHIFLGSRQHMLTRIFTDGGEPLYRMARPVTLGPIPSDLFVTFIRERFAAGHSQIATNAAESLVSATGAHPNDTQELAYFTWTLAVAQKKPATVDTVERALEVVLEAETPRFTELWESLTPPQRSVLQAVAAEETVHLFQEDLRRLHGLGSASGVQRAVSRLVDRELVESVERGTYRVPDVFFRRWLRRSVTRV
ncbi:MAG: hypothetical protein JOZ81_16480 [Chloroflexi bacterium]|nr:hypothetical protein [Chloroflexota bacterium]